MKIQTLLFAIAAISFSYGEVRTSQLTELFGKESCPCDDNSNNCTDSSDSIAGACSGVGFATVYSDLASSVCSGDGTVPSCKENNVTCEGTVYKCVNGTWQSQGNNINQPDTIKKCGLSTGS